MSNLNYGDASNPYAAPQAAVGVDSTLGGPTVAFRGFAGFWLRVAASIIDAVVINIVRAGLLVVAGLIIAGIGSNDERLAKFVTGSMQLASFFAQILYYSLMESSSTQGTLGKMALGLKVVDAQGQRISFWRALGRFLAKILSLLIVLIGFIMVAFTARKQGLHDMIAGTYVIKTR